MRYLLVFALMLLSCNQHKELALSSEQFSDFIQEDCLLIDVRSAEEYLDGHIKASATIDLYSPEFESKFMFIHSDQKMALYCNTGKRSGQALHLLVEELGYQNVVHLKGGLSAWTESGFELIEE